MVFFYIHGISVENSQLLYKYENSLITKVGFCNSFEQKKNINFMKIIW